MSVYDPALPYARPRVAYALDPEADKALYVASDAEVFTRVLALHLVAQLRPETVAASRLSAVREALLHEQWHEALLAWMEATNRRLNIFSDEPVWTVSTLDSERLALELPLTPVYQDPEPDAQ
jgi:succinylglutamate desuccinylase